jgi:hypothetical protein
MQRYVAFTRGKGNECKYLIEKLEVKKQLGRYEHRCYDITESGIT